MNIKILVATHKKYQMPLDEIYLPIHVGSNDKEYLNYTKDNTGNNISNKNANYCELTGVYWAWKNVDADYIGLSHYRRHFYLKKSKNKFASILNKEQAINLLSKFDIIVPNKRKYYIETNYSHYIHAHKQEGLDSIIQIIKTHYPDYSIALDLVMNRTWAHMFNMFIMKKEYFDKYCEWLFDILFKVEKCLDISAYTASEARVFGYLSELMLDVWLESNSFSYKELNVMFMEKQNWIIKGFNFLKRKYIKKLNKSEGKWKH